MRRLVVERAALLCQDTGGRIEAGHARAALTGALHIAQQAMLQVDAPTRAAQPRGRLRNELKAVEKVQIESALDRCGGNQTRAAMMLGIGRRTLLTKLDVLGIARPRKRTTPPR